MNRDFIVAAGAYYEFFIPISDYVNGDMRLRVYDSSNNAEILNRVPQNISSNPTVIYRFKAPVGCSQIRVYTYIANEGNSSFVQNSWSLKQISTAAMKLSGIWTPGQNYADWTAVRSIFTGSDVDHLLQVNATGGIVLDDGTTTATVDVDFTAGVEYPIEIVAGPNTADGKDEMQLNVYFSGAWHSDIQDFVGTFGPDTAAIFGLSNTYQSSVKNLVCEKLTQDMWRS